MAWMETDYSKHTHFRWKIKWRLEHLGALGVMGEIAIAFRQAYLFQIHIDSQQAASEYKSKRGTKKYGGVPQRQVNREGLGMNVLVDVRGPKGKQRRRACAHEQLRQTKYEQIKLPGVTGRTHAHVVTCGSVDVAQILYLLVEATAGAGRNVEPDKNMRKGE